MPEQFQHRARAVGIIPDGDRLLASNLSSPLLGEDPHWLWPGGRVEGEGSLEQCVVREVREETGLIVATERLIYVYQSVNDEFAIQNAEFFFLCRVTGGRLGDWRAEDNSEQEVIRDARFLTREESGTEEIWPMAVTVRVWDDLAAGFPAVVDLGYVRRASYED
ncbi:MAG: NUDIX hydrolase [Chloroflexi bacterium]|nr:NUDIX hydrolase [Chloroflexota bacterium]